MRDRRLFSASGDVTDQIVLVVVWSAEGLIERTEAVRGVEAQFRFAYRWASGMLLTMPSWYGGSLQRC